jgi:hypothetical protein
MLLLLVIFCVVANVVDVAKEVSLTLARIQSRLLLTVSLKLSNLLANSELIHEA